MQDVMRRNGLRPLVIAIDAGHGGQDPGAHGPSGTREKMITLAIAKELARQVNATPGLKAYLTRDTDVFIPLTQRYQKARAAKADLFVSIHADSSPSPEARGSSVFVLSERGASSQAARWLANQENAADLVGGVRLQDKDDTLASVLLDLSQSATMKASEDMAGQVLDGLKRLGKTHKHEIERANFVVLRSPDVPSMLVETAFISNPDEERRLNDPAQQSQLARAVLSGVTAYFSRQPPPGTLYAARADASGSGLPGGGSP
jgi:N-acetylmuramoyl-L-alanine amidase